MQNGARLGGAVSRVCSSASTNAEFSQRSNCCAVSATGMIDGQTIIMREREEKSTGTSTKTAFSATFLVSVSPGDGPLDGACGESRG